ncbi:MAG: hypothetical protein O7B99_03390, partial [Planctomycetota bacterium]|nr:hypothetical protein [Planctomycetota bacterium]
GFSTEMLAPAAIYNTPFLQKIIFSPGELGVLIADVSISREPTQQGVLPGLAEAYAVAVEEFPLDRMIDETGRRLKDISHAESRWLYRAEIEKILDVPGEELGLIDPFDPPTPLEPPGITARLHLERLDADGSGMLEGEEYQPGGGESVDLNGDGRISLGELADHVGLLDDGRSRASAGGMEPIRIRSRNDPDGDLARLLDGIDPYYFDKDKTGRLTRGEATRAMFAALDLDGDGKLVPAELSRHPGSLRRIRYDDFEKKELVGRLDSNGDMKVTRREFELRDKDWYALDQNDDGFVQLPADRRYGGRYEEVRENAMFEWPYRRQIAIPISPIISLEKMREVFDKDGDGELSRREMRSRIDLFEIIDFDGNGRVDEMEILRVVDLVSQAGVEVTVDDFMGRWDLDGDGKVEENEVPSASTLRLRGLLGRR